MPELHKPDPNRTDDRLCHRFCCALTWLLRINVSTKKLVWIGKETWLKAVGTGITVALTLFVMFEIWFLVPLPKGPIERMLGY